MCLARAAPGASVSAWLGVSVQICVVIGYRYRLNSQVKLDKVRGKTQYTRI